MTQLYHKFFNEIRKQKANLTADQIRKFAESGIPVYFMIGIIKASKKDNEVKKQIGEEGWISYEKDFPRELLDAITQKVSKGYLNAKEKEEIYSDARSFDISNERIDDAINLETNLAKAALEADKKKHQRYVMIIGTGLFLILSSALLYFLVYIPYKIDKNAPRKYVLPYSLNLRNSKILADGSVIKPIPYGSEVKIFEIDSSWAKVKVDKSEGYMSEPYKYLVDKTSFYEIDGLYGNKEAREVLVTSYLKKALLNYYKQNNLQGIISDDMQIQLYGRVLNNEVWQVFGSTKEAKFNSICEGKLTGTEENSSAVIISNLKSGVKRLLIFGFDLKGREKLIYNDIFPAEYDGLALIGKNKSIQILNNQNKKLTAKTMIVSIVAGQNNVFSPLPQSVYIFDGLNFNKSKLAQNAVN